MKSLELDWEALPVIEPMFSRRNTVFRSSICPDGIQKSVVVKRCRSVPEAEAEAKVLQMLREKKVFVPQVLGVNASSLLLEFIPGLLLSDIVDGNAPVPRDWVPELAGWFASLHTKTRNPQGLSLRKNDSNLRNFICTQAGFCGFDFEEEIYDHPEKDIGECCAYLLTYDPMFSEAGKDRAQRLVQEYRRAVMDCDSRRVRDETLRSLEGISRRRLSRSREIARGALDLLRQGFP